MLWVTVLPHLSGAQRQLGDSRILEALFESNRLESQLVVVCFMEKRKLWLGVRKV